jgi:hypothetical protein
MSKNRHPKAEERAAIKLAAHQRVEAVWSCLGVLRPDLTTLAKKALAEKVLTLCDGKDRTPPKTPRIAGGNGELGRGHRILHSGGNAITNGGGMGVRGTGGEHGITLWRARCHRVM